MTHVCRYWRESVISAPENWTRISSQLIGLAKLSLERSKSAPLELWLDVRQAGVTPEFFDLVKPHIQNAKALGVDSDSVEDEFTETLQNFLPSIRNLRSLYLRGGGDNAPSERFNDPCGHLTSSLTYLYLFEIPLHPSFLQLRTLTDFTLHNHQFNLHLDTLLDFLKENRSLEYATLDVRFTQTSLRNSRRRGPIKNRLQNLSVSSTSTMDIKALISKIAVQKGAHLEVSHFKQNTGSTLISFLISTNHLLNLRSSTFMEYCPNGRRVRTVRLLGPNGSFSLTRWLGSEALFLELPLFPLNEIRTFYLNHPPNFGPHHVTPTAFPPLFFPALETLAIEREPAISYLLSLFFSNLSSSPSLKTLAFLDCGIDDRFMEELTRFSSNHKNLHRVIIVNSRGHLPPSPSIDELGKHVPVVDVSVGKELPSDLKWNGPLG